MDNFSFFLPITKIDKEKRTISGYCSTPAKDLDGEIITLDALKKALPGYWEWRNIRRMHSQDAVGIGKEINIDEKGAFLTAKIVDDDSWNKCIEGVYKGFSIGGRKLAKTGNTITEIDWIETSIVDRPANPECSFDVNKAAKDGGPAFLLKARKSPTDRALTKMAQVVEILVDERVPDVEKREFSSKERERDSSSGAALPDGSFPIENKSDLANARQAVGRAKDKSKARAHIKARAEALGVQLPENWTKKSAKALIKAEKTKKGDGLSSPAPAPKSDEESDATKSASLAVPAFLTLDAGGGVEAVRGEIGSGHELNLAGGDSFLSLEAERSQHFDGDFDNLKIAKRERKLLKRMSVAGQLSYCFDSIRDAQRSLISEGIAEGGDQKDKGLATRLGVVAEQLAAIIGQKASHEGEEARTLSDAGDRYLRSTMSDEVMTMSATTGVTLEALLKGFAARDGLDLTKRGPSRMDHLNQAKAEMKKAKDSRKDAAKCIKSAHGLLKAHYLAKDALVKAGKKDEAEKEELDMAKVMGELQKAFGALEMNKTFAKAAGESFTKAAGRIGGSGTVEDSTPDYTPPPGLTTLSQTELTNNQGGAPLVYQLDGPALKAAQNAGFVSKSEAEALAKTAALEAENKLLRAMPATGGRPVPAAFDMSKMSGSNKPASGDLLEGIDPALFQSPNEDVRNTAMSKMVGNFIMKTPGRSVFDPAFHGVAGAKAS